MFSTRSQRKMTFCGCVSSHVSCAACLLSASSRVVSSVEVKLGMSGGFVERGLVVWKGEAGAGLANLLVYGSTLLYQGQW